MSTNGATRGKRVHWHSRAHEEWGKQRLYFWQLRFSPTYPIDEIKDALEQLFADSRIRSYMVYEVFGDSDLLLRLWLPAKLSAKDFGRMLDERLRPLDLSDTRSFEVDEVLRHWVWGAGEPSRPSTERMSEPPPTDEEIEAVNGGYASAELLKRLKGERLLAIRPQAEGIKFAMVVTIPTSEVGADAAHGARGHLAEIVDKADQIDERSLYYGNGDAASFVILGRVKPGAFNAILEQLAAPIARELDAKRIGARTYTMVVASWELLAFRDELPLARELREGEIPLEVALVEPEAERLEVKGSAFVDFRRHLLGDGELVHDERVTHSMLKTVVAMLNSDGGTLVLGALEPSRFKNCDRLDEWPRLGNYVCAGIDHDWDKAKDERWDGYERRLHDLIAQRIHPSPLVWLTLTQDWVGVQSLARVIVKRPDRNWYYLHEPRHDAGRSGGKSRRDRDESRHRAVFYVRRGGSTVPLEGVNADDYKRSQPWR